MSRPPIIGIVPGLIVDPHYRFLDYQRVAINEDYHRSVIEAGGVPVLLPPSSALQLIEAQLDVIDGLLLAGGQDIDPRRYGREPEPTTEAPSPVRDAYELAILESAHARGLPILAICRGMQMVNTWRGGTLHQEVAELGALVRHPGGNEPTELIHRVEIAEGSLLASVVGATSIEVNSFHHQAVDRLGEGLVQVAAAPDGITEAIELPGAVPVLAVQWHPEMLSRTDPAAQRLFSWLVRLAA